MKYKGYLYNFIIIISFIFYFTVFFFFVDEDDDIEYNNFSNDF